MHTRTSLIPPAPASSRGSNIRKKSEQRNLGKCADVGIIKFAARCQVWPHNKIQNRPIHRSESTVHTERPFPGLNVPKIVYRVAVEMAGSAQYVGR